MLRRVLFISLLIATFLSCNKRESYNAINIFTGTWRMILVSDKATNSSFTKPLSIAGEVELTFVPINSVKGTFTGKTPTNEIWQNEFYVGSNNQLFIPVLSMTKVAETSWGNVFVQNICFSESFSIVNDNNLEICTSSKRLLFKKL